MVAAACFVPPYVNFDGIIDSKATKEEDREVTYEQLTTTDGVLWGVSIVSHTDIDELNILQASLKAMSIAVKDLIAKSKAILPAFDVGNCHILVDGNKVPCDLPETALSKVAVIKGDSKIYSIAAASIIAKVTRDRLMVEFDKQFPIYGFAKHKGYPTASHRSILLEHGPCAIHRLSYGPVLAAAKRHGLQWPATVEVTVPSTATGTCKAEIKGAAKKMKTQPQTDSSLQPLGRKQVGRGRGKGTRQTKKEAPGEEADAAFSVSVSAGTEKSAAQGGGQEATRRKRPSTQEGSRQAAAAESKPLSKKAKTESGKSAAAASSPSSAPGAPLRRSTRLRGAPTDSSE